MEQYEPDDLKWEKLVVFVISTYEGGTAPDKSKPFFNSIVEDSVDFRVSKTHLKGVRYTVFGLGHIDYGKNFNTAAKKLDKAMHAMGAKRILKPKYADVSSSVDIFDQLAEWSEGLWTPMKSELNFKPVKGELVESDSEDEGEEGEVVDVEDLGSAVKPNKKKYRQKIEIAEDEEDDDDDYENQVVDPLAEPKEMLTATLRKSLMKQGYKLIGSHSGVKLCRWTKS